MATMSEQSNLVVNTVKGFRTLAESSYRIARGTLADLSLAVEDLPLSVVDPNIGASVHPIWTATIEDPGDVTEPPWIDAAIAGLPATAPTVPDVSVSLPGAPDEPPINTQALEATESLSVEPVTVPTLDGVPTISAALPPDPTVPGINVMVPGMGAAPTLDVRVPTLADVPGFSVSVSTLADLPAMTLEAPTLTDLPVIQVDAPSMGAAPTVNVVLPDQDTLPTVSADVPDLAPVAALGITAPAFGGASSLAVSVPALSALPTISAVVPTIDIGVLAAEFDFTEPTYTGDLSPDVRTALANVLGGSMGLPASYWSALWARAAGDLSKQMVGKARLARNRGAASYWQLPSEPVLAASREVLDETAQSLQMGRLQQALAEATMAREDFWQAVQQGLAYENAWINFHDHVAQRALGAAEQLVNLKVAVHNANVQRYNLLLDATKAQTDVDRVRLDAALRGYEAQLRGTETEVSVGKANLEAGFSAYDATLKGVQLNVDVARADTDHLLRAHDARLKGVALEVDVQKAALDAALRAYESQLKRAEVDASVQKTAVDAFLQSYEAELKKAQFELSVDKTALDAELQAYDARLKATTVETDIQKLVLDRALRGYEATLRGEQLQVDVQKAAIDAALRTYEAQLREAEVKTAVDKSALDGFISAYTASLRGTEVEVDVAKTLVDAALREYEARLKGAETTANVEKVNVDAVLRAYEARLKGSETEAMNLKTTVEAFQAKYAALTGVYNSNTQRQGLLVQNFGELVRAYNARIEGETKVAGFALNKAQIEAEVYKTNYSAIDALASATKSIVDGRVAVKGLKVQAGTARGELEAKKNQVEVQIGGLTQAAQEAKAKIDVAQQQWTTGQSNEMLKRIAELSYGYSQAAVAASSVNLSSGANLGLSQSYSASLNQPKEWDFSLS